MFIIGIDPHKGSHTVAVLDRTEVEFSVREIVDYTSPLLQ